MESWSPLEGNDDGMLDRGSSSRAAAFLAPRHARPARSVAHLPAANGASVVGRALALEKPRRVNI